VAGWFKNGDVRSDCGSQAFFDYPHIPGAGFKSAFFYRTFFYFGNTGRNADNHTGLDKPVPGKDLGNKIADHFFCGFQIRNYPVPEGPYRLDIARRSQIHAFCFFTHGYYFSGTTLNRYNGRFINYNAFAPYINQGITGSQINTDIRRFNSEHISFLLFF
jgi:hypothetical protein